MNDADIISCVRKLRRLVTTLDSIGFPIYEILNDEELASLIHKKLPERFLDTSSDIHMLAQNIEKSKRYKLAVKNLCVVKVRDEHG